MTCKSKKANSWLFALRVLERFRISQGHDVSWLWDHLNRRGMQKMSIREFGETLNEIMPEISIECGTLLGKKIARINKTPDNVSCSGLVKIVDNTPNVNSIEALLSDHPIFPQWLVARNDFQQLFIELNSENGCPSNYLVECTCRTPPESRSVGDLSIVAKWLKINKILESVKTNHLIDCAKNLNLLEVPAKVCVVTQGDPGDAFYVVLEGTLDVIIDNTVVNKMVSGTAFGEKALENDAPRSASVRTNGDCKLLVLLASDYKHLVSNAQQRRLYEVADFLFKHSICFQYFSFPRIVSIVTLATRKRFKKGQKCIFQNDPATGLMFIISGKVRCRKNISIQTLIDHRIIKKRDSFMFLGDGLPGEQRRKSQITTTIPTTTNHYYNRSSSVQLSLGGLSKNKDHESLSKSDDSKQETQKQPTKRFSVSTRLSMRVARDPLPGSKLQSKRRSIVNPEFSSGFNQSNQSNQSNHQRNKNGGHMSIFKSVITDEDGGMLETPDRDGERTEEEDEGVGEEVQDEVKEVSFIGSINSQRHSSIISLDNNNNKSSFNLQNLQKSNSTNGLNGLNNNNTNTLVVVHEEKKKEKDTINDSKKTRSRKNSEENRNSSISFNINKRNSSVGGCKRSVCVPMSDVGPGGVIGDDTVRVRSYNSYEAITLEPTEVLVVNVQEALQYWRGNALETLLIQTAMLHRSDIELVLEHEKETKKQLAKKRIRRAAIPTTYEKRTKSTVTPNGQQHHPNPNPNLNPQSPVSVASVVKRATPFSNVSSDVNPTTRRSSAFAAGMRLPPPPVSPIKVSGKKNLYTSTSTPSLPSTVQQSPLSATISAKPYMPLSLPPQAPVPSDTL